MLRFSLASRPLNTLSSVPLPFFRTMGFRPLLLTSFLCFVSREVYIRKAAKISVYSITG